MPNGRSGARGNEMASADDLEGIKMSGELTKLTSQQERLIGLIEEVRSLKAMKTEQDRKIKMLEQRADELEQY